VKTAASAISGAAPARVERTLLSVAFAVAVVVARVERPLLSVAFDVAVAVARVERTLLSVAFAVAVARVERTSTQAKSWIE